MFERNARNEPVCLPARPVVLYLQKNITFCFAGHPHYPELAVTAYLLCVAIQALKAVQIRYIHAYRFINHVDCTGKTGTFCQLYNDLFLSC